MKIAAFVLLALVAEVIGTVGGFGSSVFFVPLAQLFLSLRTVLVITGIFHVFSNLAKLTLFWKHIDHRLALVMGVPSVAFVVLGAYLTSKLNLDYSQIVLGIFLIVFSLVFLLRPNMKVPATNTNAAVSGGASGFLAGLLGTGGAVRGVSMSAFDLRKECFVATSAAIDLAVDASRSVVYLRSGYLKPEDYHYIPILLVVAVAGSYLGKLVLKRIPQDRFRKIVLVLVLLIGCTLLAQFSWARWIQ